jgi:hypothetical protein
MNDYRLLIAVREGIGVVTINGGTPADFYTEGDVLTLEVVPSSGFTTAQWYSSPNNTLISSNLSFSFTMPDQDTKIGVFLAGTNTPVNDYELKYEGDYGTNYGGDCWNLKIYKEGYSGDVSDLLINDITYNWGNLGNDPLETIVGSSVDFTIAGDTGDFNEFLTGGNRTWKVVLSEGATIFFTGFISPDFITSPYSSGKKLFSFTAIDGLKGFDSIRSNFASWPEPRNQALSAIIGGLNQSFVEQRKVLVGCEIHETRMDSDDCVFEQFNIPLNAIYTDGETAKFTNGVVIENQQLHLKDTIERMVNPFFCRVFLWKDQFYVIRLNELSKTDYKAYLFDSDQTLEDTETIVNGVDINCEINRPEETARRVFTDFNAFLNLGVLDKDSQGGVFDAKFESAEWFVMSPVSPYPNTYHLNLWDYHNAIPSNQPSSVPSGNTALVQYVSDGSGEYCQIWTTTSNAGTSDANISWISANTNSTGGSIIIAQETANTISLTFKYWVERVGSSFAISPASGTHAVGLMVKIGNQYLFRDTTTTFDWTLTPTIMEFAVTAGSVWNSIAINNVVVPTDGQVEIRLYQLICKSGTANRYALRYDDLSLKIEKTDGLSLSKLGVKAITNTAYSNVHPDYNTFIGDAITSNSASAIQLLITGNPVSEEWSRDGVESLPLLDVIVQELANLKGRTNYRIIGTLERQQIEPWKSFLFNGRYWSLVSYQLNCRTGTAQIELYDLGIEPTT